MKADEKFVQNCLEIKKQVDHVGDLNVYGRIMILIKKVLKKQDESM